MPRKILVALDLSKISEELVLYGHSLAHRLDVQVDFLHALPHTSLWRGYEPWVPPELDMQVKEIAQKKIAYWIRRAEEAIPCEHHHEHQVFVEEGNPADLVISKAKDNGYNLIVVGHKGQSALEHLIVGSTATNVVRYAHCSVLVYRPGLEIF
jgi:nucleotide-binding universal stress UspA family protein